MIKEKLTADNPQREEDLRYYSNFLLVQLKGAFNASPVDRIINHLNIATKSSAWEEREVFLDMPAY